MAVRPWVLLAVDGKQRYIRNGEREREREREKRFSMCITSKWRKPKTENTRRHVQRGASEQGSGTGMCMIGRKGQGHTTRKRHGETCRCRAPLPAHVPAGLLVPFGVWGDLAYIWERTAPARKLRRAPFHTYEGPFPVTACDLFFLRQLE